MPTLKILRRVGNIKTRTDDSVVILKAIKLALLLLLIMLIRLVPASKTPSKTIELVDQKAETKESGKASSRGRVLHRRRRKYERTSGLIN